MSKSIRGHAAALCAVCIWALSSGGYSYLRAYFTPIEIILAGILISCIVLNLVYLPRLATRSLAGELWYVLAGALGVAGFFYLEYSSLSRTSSESFSVILTLTPIACSIASNLLLKSGKSTRSFFGGFAFAALGIFLINYYKHSDLAFTLSGVIYALLAAACLGSFYAVLKRLTNMGGSAIQVIRRVFFWGVIFLLPLCFIMDFDLSEYAHLTDISVLWRFVLIGVAVPCICYVGTAYAVRNIGTGTASTYIYAAPVASIIIYSYVDHVGVGAPVLLGTVLAVIGLTLSVRK